MECPRTIYCPLTRMSSWGSNWKCIKDVELCDDRYFQQKRYQRALHAAIAPSFSAKAIQRLPSSMFISFQKQIDTSI